MLHNRLGRNIINLAIIDGANYVLPILALPFLFRTLGAESYGAIASAYSLYLFCNIIVDFGFNLSATREVSLCKSKENYSDIVSRTFLSKTLILIIVVIIVVAIVNANGSYAKYRDIFYLMLGIPIGTCFFPVWFFQGVEKMGYLTLTSTLSKLLSFVPMFFLVRESNDAYIVAICYSLGYLFASAICITVLFRRFRIRFLWPGVKSIFITIRESSFFFMSRVAASLYGVGNTFLLGMVCGATTAGYYDIASKILSAFSALLAPVTTALYPYMTKHQNTRTFKMILRFGTVLGVSLCIITIAFSSNLLIWIFDERSYVALYTFRILLLCLAFIIPSYLLGYPLLAALGHIRYTNMTVIIVGLFYIVCCVSGYLLNIYTIYFAAIIYVACEFCVFLFRVYGVNKYKVLHNNP